MVLLDVVRLKKLAEASVPVAWRHLGDVSTRRLVRTEAKNLVALRTAARAVHHQLLGHMAANPTRAAALRALGPSRAHMAGVVAQEILKARQRAKDAALDQAAAELLLLAHELKRLGYHQGLHFGQPVRSDEDADRASADAVGHSLAARWAHAVLALLVASEDDEDPHIAGRAREVMQRLDKGIGRIAATETARAYAAQHDDAVDETLGEDEDLPRKERKWLPFVAKRWNAVLDRKTCAVCRDHDGELATIGDDWSDHDMPGEVHANCRCVPALVLLPIPLSDQPDNDVEDESEGA